MHDYSSLSFWEKRYTNEHLEVFEWYQTFESLREKIIDYFKPEHKILNVGCGTSKFAEDLFYEGIKNVINIDFSESAIRLLEEHFEEQQIVSKCMKMDVLDMKEFKDEEFNIVFDKALLDSILCGENALDTVKIMLKHPFLYTLILFAFLQNALPKDELPIQNSLYLQHFLFLHKKGPQQILMYHNQHLRFYVRALYSRLFSHEEFQMFDTIQILRDVHWNIFSPRKLDYYSRAFFYFFNFY